MELTRQPEGRVGNLDALLTVIHEACLSIADGIERYRGETPRTAQARKLVKQQQQRERQAA